MDDGKCHTKSTKEGVNQGYPLYSTLAAIVLDEIIVLLMAKLKARAQQHLRSGNLGDDGNGGETDPLTYIGDCGEVVYAEDILVFLEKNQSPWQANRLPPQL